MGIVVEQEPDEENGGDGGGEERGARGGTGEETGGKRARPGVLLQGVNGEAERGGDAKKTEAVSLAFGAEFDNHAVQTEEQDGGEGGGELPSGDGETAEDEVRDEEDGGGAFERGKCLGGVPGVAEDAHPPGDPVGVEGGLGEEEIEVGALAVSDELSGEEVVALVPGEGEGLGVDQEGERKEAAGRVDGAAWRPGLKGWHFYPIISLWILGSADSAQRQIERVRPMDFPSW